MKKFLIIAAIAGALLSTSSAEPTKSSSSQVISTSGGSVTFLNTIGSRAALFEVLIAGSTLPATITVTTNGCGTGGTCELLDTYTTVANSIRKASSAVAYDHFLITVSWTGGVGVSVTIDSTLTVAGGGDGSGGGATLAGFGSATFGDGTTPTASFLAIHGGNTPNNTTPGWLALWTSTGHFYPLFASTTCGLVVGTIDTTPSADSTNCLQSALQSPGVSAFYGDGGLLSNSNSTGAVTATLVAAPAHSFWGNNTGSTAAPGYFQPAFTDLAAGAATTAQLPGTGNGAKVVTSGTLAGAAGTLLCDDGSHNATETGCSGGATAATVNYWSPLNVKGTTGWSPTAANITKAYGVAIPVQVTFAKLTVVVFAQDSTGGDLYSWGIYDSTGALKCHTAATALTGAQGTVLDLACAEGSVTIAAGKYYFATTQNSSGAGGIYKTIANNQFEFLADTSTGNSTTSGVLGSTITVPADSITATAALPWFYLHI